MDGVATTVTDSDWVAVPPTASVAVRVNVDAPAVVGVPVTTPVEVLRVRPAGSEPPVTDQV